ncbi:MAG: hypothetical protein EPGJADBJ_01311 [Saprospiraceae bacterium]|nr:hypothetical protein [Saprospiraceae bacterium]
MRYLLSFIVFFIWACGNAPELSRFEKIAKAYCECTSQLAALNEATARLASDTNAVAAFQERLQQIQTEYNKTRECTATIVAQYGKLKPVELDSLKTVLESQCAHLTEQEDLLQEMLGE